MDPDWLATLSTKDYLFPLAWPVDVWLVNLAYAPLIVWLYKRRLAAGAVVPGERGLVFGCLSLLIIFVLVLPFNQARVALAVQLQTPRIFWMLDFLATVYAVWGLAEGMATVPRRARLAAAAIALASWRVARTCCSSSFPNVRSPNCGCPTTIGAGPWRGPGTPRPIPAGWRIRCTPSSMARACASPANETSSSRRSRTPPSACTSAASPFARATASQRSVISRALTPTRARTLGAQYNLDYLVAEQPLDLPLAFQSGKLKVYRLR